MRNPFEGIEPSKIHIAVGVVACLHLLAIILWICLVATGVIGQKTKHDVPAQQRRPRRRNAAEMNVPRSSAKTSATADVLRRRRGRREKEENRGPNTATAHLYDDGVRKEQ